MLISAAADLVLRKVESLTIRQAAALLGLGFLIVVLLNGIGLMPSAPYQRLSQNPFATRTDIDPANYWQETVLLPVIAFYARLNSRLAFGLLCACIVVAAYILFAVLAFKREGHVRGVVFTAILVTSPLTTVLLAWLGSPDGLTVALAVPLIFTSSALLMFVLALLGTLNHIVFAVAAIEIVLLRLIGRDGVSRRHLISVALGAAVGYGCVQAFLAFNHIQVFSRLAAIFSQSFAYWLDTDAAALPMTLFSLFNAQWLVILVCLLICFRMDKRYYAFLTAILVVNCVITFVTLDKTRIFSLLSWGVLIECILHSSRLALDRSRTDPSYQKQLFQGLIASCLLSFIAPRYYSWNGGIFAAPFYESLKQFAALVARAAGR